MKQVVPPEAEVVAPPPSPALNSVIVLGKDQSLEDVPKPKMPFYLVSREGIYLRKWATLGTGTIRLNTMPDNVVGKIGNYNGFFSWDAPPVPAILCAQIVDFFRRIWDKHRAEAEVILTARVESVEGRATVKDWRVFIPTQRVSGGGVESVFEPTHIARNHLIVGSMHSHCNFSAFHSGIDEADAKGMDGLHITIGHVDKTVPQYAAMVSINGMHVDYSGKSLKDVADFSDLDAGKAPEWWDQYVIPTKNLATSHKPVGYGSFDKYEPSKTHTGYGGGYGNYGGYGDYRGMPPSNGYWNQYHNAGPVNNQQAKKPETTKPTGTRKLGDIVANMDKDKNQDSALLPVDVRTDDIKDRTPTLELTDEEFKAYLKSREDTYWEDNLDTELSRTLLGENIITERDIAEMDALAGKADEAWLRILLINKVKGVKKVLALMGVDITCAITGIDIAQIAKMREERAASVARQRQAQANSQQKSVVNKKVRNGNNTKGSIKSGDKRKRRSV